MDIDKRSFMKKKYKTLFFGRSAGDVLIVDRPTGWSKWDRVLSKCQHQLISNEEQCSLVALAQAGCEISLDKVVKSCLLLVVPVAKYYFRYNRPNSSLSLMDYIQLGNEGLVRAVHKFKNDRNCGFASYAMYYIKGIILSRAFTEMDFVRIPANPGGERRAPIEIAGLDEFIPSNKSNGGNEYEETYLDAIKVNDYSPDNDLMIKDFRLNLKLWFSAKLTVRECRLLELYFLHKLQLEDIGDIYGITRERIRQIKDKAIVKLRKDNDLGNYLDSWELINNCSETELELDSIDDIVEQINKTNGGYGYYESEAADDIYLRETKKTIGKWEARFAAENPNNPDALCNKLEAIKEDERQAERQQAAELMRKKAEEKEARNEELYQERKAEKAEKARREEQWLRERAEREAKEQREREEWLREKAKEQEERARQLEQINQWKCEAQRWISTEEEYRIFEKFIAGKEYFYVQKWIVTKIFEHPVIVDLANKISIPYNQVISWLNLENNTISSHFISHLLTCDTKIVIEAIIQAIPPNIAFAYFFEKDEQNRTLITITTSYKYAIQILNNPKRFGLEIIHSPVQDVNELIYGSHSHQECKIVARGNQSDIEKISQRLI